MIIKISEDETVWGERSLGGWGILSTILEHSMGGVRLFDYQAWRMNSIKMRKASLRAKKRIILRYGYAGSEGLQTTLMPVTSPQALYPTPLKFHSTVFC